MKICKQKLKILELFSHFSGFVGKCGNYILKFIFSFIFRPMRWTSDHDLALYKGDTCVRVMGTSTWISGKGKAMGEHS